MPSEEGAKKPRGQGAERETLTPSGNEPASEARAAANGKTLEEVLDRYLQELAEGRSPDQEAYVRAHPELADALRGVFKTLDFVEATSRSLDGSKLERDQQLGEYRIVREVGRGGMGVVYEAVQASLNRRVALKVLPAGALLSGSAAERFAREAATAGRLHHTNIVPVYGVGQEQGVHYYAMQFIEGRSLSDHLTALRAGRTTPGRDYFRRVARWGQQVAEALEYAHRQGTIHRDVKPSNLLLDGRDNVWVTDFGLARADALTTITLSGDVIGTARYMSPEQARGGRTQLDGRTDIYSLGATLYELLTLVPAFDGESREAVLNQIAFADPKPLRQISRAIARDLETIVGKCMEKEPERRYQRAQELAEDCRRFASGEPIRARRTPAVVKAARFLNRHRLQASGAVFALVLLVATMLLVVRIRHVQGQRCLDEAFDAILFEQDPGHASQLLDTAASLGVDAPELHLYRGLIPLLNRRPQHAVGHLNEALQRDPENVEAGLGLAYAYTATGDFFNGRRLLERVSEQDIATPLGWLLHGLCLGRIQRSAAIESYNRAIALRPDFTPAISARAIYRGTRLLIEGARAELQPMLDDFDAVVIFRPASSRSYANRAGGWLFAAAYAGTQADLRELHASSLANCERDLEEALARGGANDFYALARQGVYLRYIGDLRGSADAFAQAIAIGRSLIGSSDRFLLHERAIALHGLGEHQTALDELLPVYESSPDPYAIELQRALLLAELGRLDEARRACRTTLQQQRGNATALFLSAAFMELLGDRDAATAVLTEFAARGDVEFTSEDATETTFAPALDYLLGHSDASALLVAAGSDPGRRCEFSFLIALRELGRGNRQAGLAALQGCLDTGVVIFGEHRFAQAMLARAQADPDWPRWVAEAR
jgi:Flp pilus assembly protein TadD